MHLQLPAHGVEIRPVRGCLSTLGPDKAIAPDFSRAIDPFGHFHQEMGCLPRMSVRVESRSPAITYRFCEPSSSTCLKPAQMAPHGGGAQYGIWVLFELFEWNCFFGSDLWCIIRISRHHSCISGTGATHWVIFGIDGEERDLDRKQRVGR